MECIGPSKWLIRPGCYYALWIDMIEYLSSLVKDEKDNLKNDKGYKAA